MAEIEINEQFTQVLQFVDQTNRLIFLTGKAGTGKTTLLKHIREKTYKQIAVVAPTGVAAINAGGTTIHSFFQFPFTPFLPLLRENGSVDVANSKLPALKYSSQRLSIFRSLELLVVDEVSMVRADLLDQMDLVLRQTRRNWSQPFGGVQVLLIGDMHQLPPVVQPEEWSMLRAVYSTPFFFDSVVMRQHPPVFIELEKIYRQADRTFIDLLNKVRNNQLDEEALGLLNSHYKAHITPQEYRENITLTTHNRKADEINMRNLHALPGRSYELKCRIEGTFPERSLPADEVLTLRKGTRVMFLKNNTEKNYYNGKIGIVVSIDDKSIFVKCDEDHSEIEVFPETWMNVTYEVDKSTKHIHENVVGTFTQYPLRLAWAITIHKSQGLTFDKLIIDAAESFSAGQVYVALSRCRRLDGLTLSSKIERRSVLNDENIVSFSSLKLDHGTVNALYNDAHNDYLRTLLLDLFDLTQLMLARKEIAALLLQYKTRFTGAGLDWAAGLLSDLDKLHDTAAKFRNQLSGLLLHAGEALSPEGPAQERIRKASQYFSGEFEKMLTSLKNPALVTENKEAATALNEQLQLVHDGLYAKKALMRCCGNGFEFQAFVKARMGIVFPASKVSCYASAKNIKANADVKHKELFRELLALRDEICEEDQLPVFMVGNVKTLTELASFLPSTEEDLLRISGFGKARVQAFGEKFLSVIRDYMHEHGLQTEMDLAPKKKKNKKSEGGGEKTPRRDNKIPTRETSYSMFLSGLSPAEIAKQRGLTQGTIENHLIPYIKEGIIDISKLVSGERVEKILHAAEEAGTASLNEIRSHLPDDYTYNEIRLVMAGRTSV